MSSINLTRVEQTELRQFCTQAGFTPLLARTFVLDVGVYGWDKAFDLLVPHIRNKEITLAQAIQVYQEVAKWWCQRGKSKNLKRTS